MGRPRRPLPALTASMPLPQLVAGADLVRSRWMSGQIWFAGALIFLSDNVNFQLTLAMFALMVYFFISSQLQHVGLAAVRAAEYRSLRLCTLPLLRGRWLPRAQHPLPRCPSSSPFCTPFTQAIHERSRRSSLEHLLGCHLRNCVPQPIERHAGPHIHAHPVH